MVRFTLGLAIVFVAACARSPSVQGSEPAPEPARCSYEVRGAAAAPYRVNVTARCEGAKITGFRAASADLARFVHPQGAPRAQNGALFSAAELAPTRAELRYEVDLDALARSYDDMDVARRFGASLLAPASSFLLAPDPDPNGAPVSVSIEAPGVTATGLRRAQAAYAIETHELRVATYVAFGAHSLHTFSIGPTRVHVARLDGPLTVPFDAVLRWIEKSARAVTDFYDRPLDTEITLIVAPLPAMRGIPFGKLLPESGPGIVILLGEHTLEPELYRDWVLVHELFHVGSPSFQNEGKWFDEGLATYFEPLIRARAGFTNENAVWAEFLQSMPRGLRALTERGLEHAEDYADRYWGGALFCLLADLEIRTRSEGRQGLEDGVRAVLANGGIASEVWPLSRSLETADRVFGAPVLVNLARRYADRGEHVDLPALFENLGVFLEPNGGVRYDENAPLAAVRRALVFGGRTPVSTP